MSDIEYDELGPAKVLKLHSEKMGIAAIVVVENTALGPSIGGVRVSPTVNEQELLRLARTMTLKKLNRRPAARRRQSRDHCRPCGSEKRALFQNVRQTDQTPV